jgi:hypothetical protein
MTPDEHAAQAEAIVAEAFKKDAGLADPAAIANMLRRAQVHATLALRGQPGQAFPNWSTIGAEAFSPPGHRRSASGMPPAGVPFPSAVTSEDEL